MDNILVFEPYFAHVIWGGDRIAKFKGIASQGEDVGESWEISSMPGRESIVASGCYAGEKLTDLIDRYGMEIMGERLYHRFGGKFPLLVKFIDSRDDLSIQVHPDDELAAQRHGKLGKTEMWYSIAPAEGAYLYAGFKRELSAEEFRRSIEDNTIVSILQKHYTVAGDVFYLPAGCIHSLGRGNFVCEIQQASDVAYRIYDYDRRDAQGNTRELHVEQSLEATRLDAAMQAEAAARNIEAAPGESAELVHCPYYNTDLLNVAGSTTINLAERDSFTILISVRGSAVLKTANQSITLQQGSCALIPAGVSTLTIEGSASIISVYIP